MKKNTYFYLKMAILMAILSNSALLLKSCKSDLSKNEGKSISAIPASEAGTNAAMINNPMTADESKMDTTNLAQITFDENIHKFGTIKEGKVVTHVFTFKNTGKSPLLIKECVSSCGCTVPTFPKAPILPGESNKIEVKFDSKNKEGHIQKKVSVYANTLPNETFLGIEADVKK
jgi:hypothetical protein